MTDLPTLPMIRPTQIERLMGRLMRAPDHDAGDPPADPAASDPPVDSADDLADDPSLISSAQSDPKDPADPKDPDAADDPAATELPEKYELTAPEGMEIDETVLAEVDPVFRDLGLNNEQANKLMPLAGKLAERITATQRDAHAALAADWAKAAKADPRIGGKNWAETERLVARALDTAAAGLGKDGKQQVADFKTLLDETRLGDHPVLISMFRFYGERISEDTDFSRSDAGAAVRQDRLAALYPNDVPQEAT